MNEGDLIFHPPGGASLMDNLKEKYPGNYIIAQLSYLEFKQLPIIRMDEFRSSPRTQLFLGISEYLDAFGVDKLERSILNHGDSDIGIFYQPAMPFFRPLEALFQSNPFGDV